MTPIAQALVFGALALGTATGAVSVMSRDIPDLVVPDGPWQPGSALDGRVFHSVDRIAGSDEVLEDELHFAGGTFQSAKCQEYCDFGWSEYRTKQVDGVLHFTATTRCPDAPHTVVWYGQVTGDAIAFEATWTTRRWYWSYQIEVTGAGSTPPLAAADT
jgi:hypothetical protein